MPKNSLKFPHKIKHRNATVTIYKSRRKDTKSGFIYEIAYRDPDGKRVKKQIVDLDDALAWAREKVEILSSGKMEAANVHPADLEQLASAKRILGDFPILSAIKEWKKANDLTEGSIIPVAQAWRDANNSKVKKLGLNEAVDRFLRDMKKNGINVKASYLRTLPRFIKDFGNQNISSISTRQLQDWLNDSFSHPTTRNTHRKRIVTMFRWSRDQGYLPRNAQTEAELTSRAKEAALEIGITDAQTYFNLLCMLRDRHPHYLAAGVLAGLCGMRRVEVHGQLWKDIHLEKKFVRVSAAKTGTPAKRHVTLCDAAIEWLLLCEKNPTGEVCLGSTMVIDRIRFIGKKNSLDLPANCFRHSYISCRVAATGEVDRTALEAGTSARMIHKHYRELVTKEEGEDWFSISPTNESGKVVNFEK
jgi:integrase